MTTHTLTITDHPYDGEPIVSLDGGTHLYGSVMMVPIGTEYSEGRAALVEAVRDLTGPRDQLPADLRDDRRIAWVPDAGDGEGAWFAPLPVRLRLYNEGWTLINRDDRHLIRPPSAPATEQVPAEVAVIHRRQVTHDEGPFIADAIVRHEASLSQLAVVESSRSRCQSVADDGTVTVMADTDQPTT